MKKDVKCLLSALVFAGISWGGYGIASAAGDAVYELNPVVVTATRTEKMDVDVPANVTVVTAKKIEEAGYKNAFDAIQSQVAWRAQGMGMRARTLDSALDVRSCVDTIVVRWSWSMVSR